MTINKKIIEKLKQRSKDLQNNALYHTVLNDNLAQVLEKQVYSQMKTADGRTDKTKLSINTNFLKKIVNKLSQLYTAVVSRNFGTSTERDKEIAAYYMKTMKLDSKLQRATMLYNGTKSVLIELLYDSKYQLGLRLIPNDSYFLYSDDENNLNELSHVIKIIDKEVAGIYTRYSYQIISADTIVTVDFEGKETDSKPNLLGFLPFVHVNSELDSLFPRSDYDTLSTLLQCNSILTDANVSNYWSSFPITFGTNIDTSQLDFERHPGAFYVLNPMPGSTQDPTISTVAPSLNTADSLALAREILSGILDSKGIKLSSGDATSSIQSGVAALIDAADTSEVRKIIGNDWAYAEEELWAKIAEYHSWLVVNKLPLLPAKMPKTLFSDDFEVIVDFPLTNTHESDTVKEEVVDEVNKKVEEDGQESPIEKDKVIVEEETEED